MPAPPPTRTLELPAETYRDLVNAVVDYAIFMLDPEGHVVSWNLGAERINGYSREEILGQHFSVFFTPEARAAGIPEKALAKALREGRHQDEGWRLRKDGTPFWALTALDAVRDERGELIGLAKITRDMTEQRLAQQALRDSERNFRLLVDGVTDYAIYRLDTEGRISSWNSGAERIKGYRADEVIGAHFSLFFAPEDRAADVPGRALRAALEQGRFSAEGWRVRKNGERFWASVVVDPIRDEAGRHIGFAKVTRDVTERRLAEERLEQARQQLLQSQKLEALGQFTGGLAHDFNNLLTIIRGAADLARRLTEEPRLLRQIESIGQAAERGGEITRQLLTFARRQPLKAQVIDPGEALRSCLPLLKQSLPRTVTLALQVPDDLPLIEVDPVQLELALLNLTLNARDAVGDPGRLTLGAESCTLSGAPDGLMGRFVAIRLEDNGKGMSEEIRARVFEPFFTTKSFGKGSGLGLSQVHGFARQSGGTVMLDSQPDQGTTVTLLLPVHHAGTTADETTGRNKRVLLLEDDRNVAEVAQGMLEAMGYDVLVAHEPDEALNVMDRVARIDLLFSDVVMPGGISGLELANRLRERMPELPVLLTTGYSEVAQGSNYPLLPKPYTYESLARAIEALV
ncbi:PAS domain S-box protein [Stutzerimonas urumqiensis]|uniref:hybrid sensor histidine kinase/response regulator n=1 Tax=Stutzerimonas urumqiensis TaxID=638269 RepID=UPI003DA39AF8